MRRAAEAAELEAAELAASAGVREGQLKEGILEDFSGEACARPGCYELFQRQPHEPEQRFCCAACGRALRRVREREARWRSRREEVEAGHDPPNGRCGFDV